jgi:hypothetical protein
MDVKRGEQFQTGRLPGTGSRRHKADEKTIKMVAMTTGPDRRELHIDTAGPTTEKNIPSPAIQSPALARAKKAWHTTTRWYFASDRSGGPWLPGVGALGIIQILDKR